MSLRIGSGSASASDFCSGAARKKLYKSIIDAEKGRRRREEDLVVIRKSKREEYLLKKRREIQAKSFEVLFNDIAENAQRIRSEDPDEQLAATVSFGNLLALENPPIEEVVMAGVVPRFLEFLSREDAPQLQLEAVWVLTNITAGESLYTSVVVYHNSIPSLVNLLSSTNDDIREQTVGALGNIAGDSARHRDIILHHGALLPLLSLLQPHSRLSLLRQATWCLSNVVRGHPPVKLEQVRPALPVLQHLIHFNDDEEVLKRTCWALSYLTEGPTRTIQAVVELGVCPKLVEFLLSPSDRIALPAIRTLGNIAAGNDVQTQVVLDNRLLPFLHQLLTKEYKKRIFLDACYTISNVTAGTKSQIQAVIDANIIPIIVEILYIGDAEVKRAAAWAILNLTTRGSKENIRFLADQGCIKPLCELLDCPDPTVVLICLEVLEKILKAGRADQERGLRKVNYLPETEGLYEKIYNLVSHENNDITLKALRLCKRIHQNLRSEDEFDDSD